MEIAAIAQLAPVIPVLTVEGPKDGVPLARALVAGGLRALEVTLRTEGALEALRAMAAEVPEAVMGAGTVLTPRHLELALEAGARFIVSPGCTPALAREVKATGVGFMPGIQTVSESMAMAEQAIASMMMMRCRLCWKSPPAITMTGGGFGPTDCNPPLLLLPEAATTRAWASGHVLQSSLDAARSPCLIAIFSCGLESGEAEQLKLSNQS